MADDVLVHGESAKAILGALAGTEPQITDDGMYRFDWVLTADEASPVARATMRAEAALLLDDAASFSGVEPPRTPEHRRADALYQVIVDAAAALELCP